MITSALMQITVVNVLVDLVKVNLFNRVSNCEP